MEYYRIAAIPAQLVCLVCSNRGLVEHRITSLHDDDIVIFARLDNLCMPHNPCTSCNLCTSHSLCTSVTSFAPFGQNSTMADTSSPQKRWEKQWRTQIATATGSMVSHFVTVGCLRPMHTSPD
jgi:hypothetical protein